jgi:hypothetical protein
MVPGVIDRLHGIVVVLALLSDMVNTPHVRRCKAAADVMIDARPQEYNEVVLLARTETVANSDLTSSVTRAGALDMWRQTAMYLRLLSLSRSIRRDYPMI